MSELIEAIMSKKDAKKQMQKLAKLWGNADYHLLLVEKDIEILSVKMAKKIMKSERKRDPSERELANIQKYKDEMKLLMKKRRKLNKKRNSLLAEYSAAVSVYSEAKGASEEIISLQLATQKLNSLI